MRRPAAKGNALCLILSEASSFRAIPPLTNQVTRLREKTEKTHPNAQHENSPTLKNRPTLANDPALSAPPDELLLIKSSNSEKQTFDET